MIQKVIVTCYFIAELIQNKNIYMHPETEIRFHNICPSIAAHLVNGEHKSYDGVIETLMNRLQGQHDEDWDTCVLWSEEDKLLRTIGLSCDMIRTD